METKQFSVPALATAGQALDLSNVLNAVKGVASISIDLPGHLVAIEFDPVYTSARTLADTIDHSGYQSDRSSPR